MPALTLNKTVEQTGPQLKVTNRLQPGKYRFRLSVIDDAGNESKPTELTVTVTAPGRIDLNLNRDIRRVRDPRRRRVNPDTLRDRITRR